MKIDPRRLSYLLAVHREGGVVAAADALDLSPSAVSQQIRRLEDEAGLTLLRRSPTGTEPTPAGRILLAGAEKIEEDLSEIARNLRPMTGQITGVVRIGGFQTIIRNVLLPLSTDLEKALPGVEIHIDEVDETEGMTELRSGRLDLLMLERDTNAGAAPKGFTDEAFIDEPWVLVSPESAPRVGSERDLADVQWLRLSPHTIGYHTMHRIIASLPHPQWVPYSYNNYEAAHALIRAGRGATILPSMAVRGIPLDDMRVTSLPGLGFRRILVRYRDGDDELERASGQVLSALFHWIADHHDEWGRPPE